MTFLPCTDDNICFKAYCQKACCMKAVVVNKPTASTSRSYKWALIDVENFGLPTTENESNKFCAYKKTDDWSVSLVQSKEDDKEYVTDVVTGIKWRIYCDSAIII